MAGVKKLIQIDIVSDTVCPWCFVGKRNLEKAFEASLIDSTLRLDGIHSNLIPVRLKKELIRETITRKNSGLVGRNKWRLGCKRFSEATASNITCPDSRHDKQHDLVGELFLGYFTQAKYIGDREYLLQSARKVGVEGAAEFLEDPNNGLDEVNEELKKYSRNINGVPHFLINNGKHALSGGQPPEVFLRAFEAATE